MPPVKTRECTRVFTSIPMQEVPVEFSTREVQKVERFSQKIFRSTRTLTKEQVLSSLSRRLDLEVARKLASKKQVEKRARKPQMSWKDKVNKKRDFIRRVISHQTTLNLREVAKYTKSCWKTVRRVREEMLVHGSLSPYNYNFLKSPQELENLHTTIEAVKDTGMAVSDIKRVHPDFSKQKILREMHEIGLKFRPLPRERKQTNKKTPNGARVLQVISHLAQAMDDPETEVLYCDEMKFPLFQTSTHSWTSQLDCYRGVYNRREDDRVLTAIALCSTKGFLGVQVYKQEVTGPDFLYFLNSIIAGLPQTKSYTVLADNASWHHANIVDRSAVSGFIFFNEPRIFQLSII